MGVDDGDPEQDQVSRHDAREDRAEGDEAEGIDRTRAQRQYDHRRRQPARARCPPLAHGGAPRHL
jgi:hypothetical protein